MKPSIIPMPQSIKYTGGKSTVNESLHVSVTENKSLKKEEYTLTLNEGKVSITCSDRQGEFYARQTLKQIIASCNGECDNLVIEDYPEKAHRGFMLDCARHFFTMEETKKVIDTAAYLKLNTFHWHITDDQGWRLPVAKYPDLITIGSKRADSKFGGTIEGFEYGGSLTEEDIKDIVAYCEERFIEVIPEIDMPGHTTSVLAAYPHLGCTGEKVEVGMKEGIYETVLCLGNEEVTEFIHEVLDTACRLFPGRYIHIGGDETPRTRWKECPKCRQKLASYGTDDFDKLQGYFIKETAQYLKSKGKTAISWNESLKGDVLDKDDVIIQRWMDNQGLSKAFAAKGGKVIETDFYHCYCDYPYGMTPVKKVYKFSLSSKIKNKNAVVGTEAELWTEYVRNFDDICRMLYPRVAAVAENGWTKESKKNYSTFVTRHEALRKSFENMGIKIIPVDEWGMPPHKRLADILKFFKGSLNLETLKNAFNNQK